MSAAYMDATSGIEKSIEQCNNIFEKYNAHIGFINLCATCYINKSIWAYQKAVKPQSGVLGKLSSEIILRFIQKINPQFVEVLVVGGIDFVDAILKHKNTLITNSQLQACDSAVYLHNCGRIKHGKEYVTPFISMLWGLEEDLKNSEGGKILSEHNLRKVFDFLITLEDKIYL